MTILLRFEKVSKLSLISSFYSQNDIENNINPRMPEFFITRGRGFVDVSIGKQT